jgi:hypothetical protein
MRSKLLVGLLMVFTMMGFPAVASAAPGFQWSVLGGDPLVPGGVHSKADVAKAFISATVQTAMARQGASPAVISAVAKTAQNPANVSGCLLKYGQTVRSMSFHAANPRVDLNAQFSDSRYQGSRGAWSFCVRVEFGLKSVTIYSPWKLTATKVNTDGSKNLTYSRVVTHTASGRFEEWQIVDKCGNNFPLTVGATSSAISSVQTRVRHVKAPPKKPTPTPSPKTAYAQLSKVAFVNDQPYPLKGGEFAFGVVTNGGPSLTAYSTATGINQGLGQRSVGDVVEVCEQVDKLGYASGFKPDTDCITHTFVAGETYTFAFVNRATDFCPNQAGIQTGIPNGQKVDGAGNCYVPAPPTPTPPTPTPPTPTPPTPTPQPAHAVLSKTAFVNDKQVTLVGGEFTFSETVKGVLQTPTTPITNAASGSTTDLGQFKAGDDVKVCETNTGGYTPDQVCIEHTFVAGETYTFVFVNKKCIPPVVHSCTTYWVDSFNNDGSKGTRLEFEVGTDVAPSSVSWTFQDSGSFTDSWSSPATDITETFPSTDVNQDVTASAVATFSGGQTVDCGEVTATLPCPPVVTCSSAGQVPDGNGGCKSPCPCTPPPSCDTGSHMDGNGQCVKDDCGCQPKPPCNGDQGNGGQSHDGGGQGDHSGNGDNGGQSHDNGGNQGNCHDGSGGQGDHGNNGGSYDGSGGQSGPSSSG